MSVLRMLTPAFSVMNIISSATKHLNPGQTPVIAMDQPLFALAKEIQWNWPDTHGENVFVVMMGGLHIEMASLRLLGDWLDGSGWTNVITASGITSSGTADSFVKASHVTRTRHAHQVTAAALYILQQKAYSNYKDACDENLSFEQWSRRMEKQQPQFAYWNLVLQLQLTVLDLVHAMRSADFQKYLETLVLLMPWMFALDRTNYARWLSVHIRDMQKLETDHNTVHSHFASGGFVVQKTKNKFSAIPLDQAHEQCNALVKGDGGAVGLTSNPNALKRWMIAGPEVSRMIKEFEEQTSETNTLQNDHHDQIESVQSAFKEEVKALISSFEAIGSPFEEDSGYLLALDTKHIMPPPVVDTVFNIVSTGQTQYTQFVEDRLMTQTKAISDPIKRNNLPCFAKPGPKTKGAVKTGIAALKKRLLVVFPAVHCLLVTRWRPGKLLPT